MSFISKLLNNSSSSRAKQQDKQSRQRKSLSSSLRSPEVDGDDSDVEAHPFAVEAPRNLHSDPVPSSFKSGSFVNAARTHNNENAGGLTLEMPAANAWSSDSINGSSPCSPPARRRVSGLERPRSPMLASGSYKSPFTANTAPTAGSPGTAASASVSSPLVMVRGTEPPSVARDGGAQQCWNLPWVQQKVTMCPYCHRPIRPHGASGVVASSRDDVVNSSADDVAGRGRAGLQDSDRNLSHDSSSFGDALDRDDDLLLEEEAHARSVAYCHCEHRLSVKASQRASGLALDASANGRSSSGVAGAAAAPQASGSVFVLRTERSSNMRISGIIAEDSSESDSNDGADGVHGDARNRSSQKLCLVAPSPALTAQNSRLHSQQPSPRSKVSNWAREQEEQSSSSPVSEPKEKTSVKPTKKR